MLFLKPDKKTNLRDAPGREIGFSILRAISVALLETPGRRPAPHDRIDHAAHDRISVEKAATLEGRPRRSENRG